MGRSSVKQSGGSIRDVKRSIAALPTTIAHDVATRGAPVLTALALTSFDSNQSVYGDPRPLGVDGEQLTLERTGATRRTLRFTSSGTIMRCVLGTKYARFLIGKYSVLPNGAMPEAWRAALGTVVAEAKAVA